MSSIAEIETAIEKLPAPQVDELAGWLETLRVRRATPRRLKAGCNPHAVLHGPVRRQGK
jgi:hypothetical protein